MTLVAAPLSYLLTIPGILFAAATTAFTFDASTDLMAVVFRVPATGTIDKIHYRISGVSSPVMTHRISLQTVSATTGLPNGAGSLYGGSSAVTVNAATYSANTNYSAAVNCAATAGDLVALVFDLSAFTSGSFNQVELAGNILYGDAFSSGQSTNFPYTVYNTSGSTAKSNGIRTTGFALEYSTPAAFIPVDCYYNWVGSGTSTAVTNSGTTRVGNIFRPAVPRRAVGIWMMGSNSGDVLLRLRLASDDSILATVTIDKDQVNGATILLSFFRFDSGATVNLVAGTDYYITMEGNDATGGSLGTLANLPSAAAMDIMPGGQTCYGVTYSGSYTSATTQRHGIGLITDQEDDGAGGAAGGLLTHPGMSGGMRG